MPGKLNFISQKCKHDSLLQTNAAKCEIDYCETDIKVEDGNMNESELKNNWFKTWPEKNCDKLDQTFESLPEGENCSTSQIKNTRSYIPLNKLLDKIPLAYSPVTKQLHVLPSIGQQQNVNGENQQSFDTSEVIENCSDESDRFWTTAPEINENGKMLVLQTCLTELDQSNKEEKLCKLWNSKIGYSEQKFGKNDQPKSDHCANRTETSSFSSIVSSLSDNSHLILDEGTAGKFSMLENDDLSVRSLCSHDSESTCGENSKFFEERNSCSKDNKRKGLSGFFSRNVFAWKPTTNSLTSQGWKIFGKSQEIPSSSRNREVIDKKKSIETEYEGVIVSSSALILHDRPDNLPAKSLEEQEKHRLEYEQMVEAAKKKDIKESKRRKKKLQQQLKIEEKLTSASKTWTTEILPKWETMKNAKKTRDLWWTGIPPSVRGKIWKLAIGNELNITHQLYEICSARAQEKLKSVESKSGDENANDVNKESSVELIQLDISRTFPQLCIFQKGGPYYDILHCLLGAYVCYRPDVGYVQGMSFIAAVLILNLEPADAFVCFANLLNRPCHLAFFTLNQPFMHAYYDVYNDFFRENLPKLCQHFEESSLTPDLYLLDWVYSVFAKAMPLDIACRIWDVFLRDGEEFLFKTALGILHLHQEKLMKLDFINGAQFLRKLPDDLSSDLLFKSIDSIKMCVGKVKFGEALSNFIEKCSSR